MLLRKVFSRKVYRYFYHYVAIDLFTVTAAILNLLHLRSIMGCPGGALAQYLRALFGKKGLHCIFLWKKAIIITSKHGTTTFFPITIFFGSCSCPLDIP